MFPYSALAHAAHQATLEKAMTDGEVSSGALVPLWMVVEVSAQDFSEKIEYNEELDLLLAPEGRFVGFAKSKAEADEMTTGKLVELAPPETEDEKILPKVKTDSVYLTYKADFRGTADLQKLLEFLLTEGLLKPQS